MKTLKKTYHQALLDYIAEYRAKHGDDAIDPMALANDAMKHGLAPRRTDPAVQLARDFAKAMRHEIVEDRQGRKVRQWHAIRKGVEINGISLQQVWWDNKDSAKPPFMRVSLQQRRQGIFHDCLRLKADSDSYNDNNKYGAKLPHPEFNFEPDIEEHEHSTQYPDEPPADE